MGSVLALPHLTVYFGVGIRWAREHNACLKQSQWSEGGLGARGRLPEGGDQWLQSAKPSISVHLFLASYISSHLFHDILAEKKWPGTVPLRGNFTGGRRAQRHPTPPLHCSIILQKAKQLNFTAETRGQAQLLFSNPLTPLRVTAKANPTSSECSLRLSST